MAPILLAVRVLAPTALADEEAPATWAGDQAAESSPSHADLITEAVPVRRLTSEQYEWLEPRRHRLPADPHALTDFTAYTLEWGEVKLGLANVAVGALPRFQLGTVPMLDVAGIPNGNAKVDALRAGPFDLALAGSHYRLPQAEFLATSTSAEAVASLRVVGPWSLHAAAGFARVEAAGSPDLGPLEPALAGLIDDDAASFVADDLGEMVDVDLRATATTARVATDIRLNRRDSLVLQGTAMLWGEVDAGVAVADVPADLGSLEWELAWEDKGAIPLRDAYMASLAWNIQLRQLEARVGVGLSSVPGAWLLQATELSWHFGGPTRRAEARMTRTWRRNREVVVYGT